MKLIRKTSNFKINIYPDGSYNKFPYNEEHYDDLIDHSTEIGIDPDTMQDMVNSSGLMPDELGGQILDKFIDEGGIRITIFEGFQDNIAIHAKDLGTLSKHSKTLKQIVNQYLPSDKNWNITVEFGGGNSVAFYDTPESFNRFTSPPDPDKFMQMLLKPKVSRDPFLDEVWRRKESSKKLSRKPQLEIGTWVDIVNNPLFDGFWGKIVDYDGHYYHVSEGAFRSGEDKVFVREELKEKKSFPPGFTSSKKLSRQAYKSPERFKIVRKNFAVTSLINANKEHNVQGTLIGSLSKGINRSDIDILVPEISLPFNDTLDFGRDYANSIQRNYKELTGNDVKVDVFIPYKSQWEASFKKMFPEFKTYEEIEEEEREFQDMLARGEDPDRNDEHDDIDYGGYSPPQIPPQDIDKVRYLIVSVGGGMAWSYGWWNGDITKASKKLSRKDTVTLYHYTKSDPIKIEEEGLIPSKDLGIGHQEAEVFFYTYPPNTYLPYFQLEIPKDDPKLNQQNDVLYTYYGKVPREYIAKTFPGKTLSRTAHFYNAYQIYTTFGKARYAEVFENPTQTEINAAADASEDLRSVRGGFDQDLNIYVWRGDVLHADFIAETGISLKYAFDYIPQDTALHFSPQYPVPIEETERPERLQALFDKITRTFPYVRYIDSLSRTVPVKYRAVGKKLCRKVQSPGKTLDDLLQDLHEAIQQYLQKFPSSETSMLLLEQFLQNKGEKKIKSWIGKLKFFTSLDNESSVEFFTKMSEPKKLSRKAQSDETIAEGEYADFVRTEDGYEYLSGESPNGVAVLIYRTDSDKPFLGRFERVPAHDEDKPELHALTGTIDGDDSPKETAVREVEEESGYKITKDELIPLGEVNPAKNTDWHLYMFAVHIGPNHKQVEPEGDGTKGEKEAYNDWVDEHAILDSEDAVLQSLLLNWKNMQKKKSSTRTGKTYKHQWLSRKLDELRKQYGGVCKICGSEKDLEFAHLKPTGLRGMGRGKESRYYDIKYNPEAYTLLCRRCHKELDRNYLHQMYGEEGLPEGIYQQLSPSFGAVYPGNMGIEELYKFWQQASPEQEEEMLEAVEEEDLEKVEDLIEEVLHVRLYPIGDKMKLQNSIICRASTTTIEIPFSQPQDTFTIFYDIDGTVARYTGDYEKYEFGEPIYEVVDVLNHFKADGAQLIPYTSRKDDEKEALLRWLDENNIPYDDIIMNKPHFDVLIDDKVAQFTGDPVALEETIQKFREEKFPYWKCATMNLPQGENPLTPFQNYDEGFGRSEQKIDRKVRTKEKDIDAEEADSGPKTNHQYDSRNPNFHQWPLNLHRHSSLVAERLKKIL